MKARLAAVASVLLATGAMAQGDPDFYQPDLDRLEGSLGEVQLPQANFYSGDEKPGCPAIRPACRRPAYVRSGDMVVVSKTQAALVWADFTAGGTRSSSGWLARSVVVPMPAPAVKLADWRGGWVRDQWASISLKPGKRPGTLAVTGDATWPTPGGSVNMGDLDDAGTPKGDRLAIGDAEENSCRVRMRLLPPYLIVADNGNCGGMNVSFSGAYRRTR